jgi:hypothetical protein
MAFAPNTEFCTIDTIDSIRSLYVTERNGETISSQNITHTMFHGTHTKH